MSQRNLPKIQAFDRLSEELSPVPADHALARWTPGVKAATEGDQTVISIYDVIGEDPWTGDGMTSRKMAGILRSIGARDVTVNINSPGGDFFEGIAIYNLLREHPHHVTIKVMGLAASAASVIAMAGDKILISNIGFLMIHNAWAVAVGNRHDMTTAASTLEPFDDAMAGLYATRAGVDKVQAAEWMDAETWFNGAQAIEVGLADGQLAQSEVQQTNDTGAKSLAAVRRVDAALARQGLPRSERKSLIVEMKGGKPGAAPDAMTGSGDVAAALSSFIATMTPSRH